MSEDVLKVRLTAEGIQEVLGALKKVRVETERTGKAGKEATDTLGALGTIFAAQQIAAFAKHAFDAADGLGKMAQKTGVAVEELSVLTYMGQQADLSNQDLEKGLVKLSKSLVGLRDGEAVATEAFARLGLSAEDLKDLSLDQVLLRVANAQARFADGAGKADTMMDLLGKSGANMIPLLNDLAEGGFENARKKLQDLGLVISDDMAEASQEFNDSMARLEMAAQGATVQVAQGMLPGLTKAIDGLTASLAAMPAGAKAFAGGFLVVGSAATATAVAVRGLSAAFVGLGPAGIAIVAISALVAGIMSINAAMDAARAEDLKRIDTQGRMVKSSAELEQAYRKESAALAASSGNKREAERHAAKLREIESGLIELSPELEKTLKDQSKGWRDKADAIRAAREQAQESLRIEKMTVANEIADRIEQARKRHQEQTQNYAMATGKKVAKPTEADLQAVVDSDPGIQLAKEKLDRIQAALGEKALAAGTGTKEDITTSAADLLRAQANAAVAEAKRLADEVKVQVEAFSAINEDFYRQGLIDLETYAAARRQALETSAAAEVAILEAQVKAEIAARAKGMTEAEKLQSETKVADLQAQIALKRQQTETKLAADERKIRDEREKGLEEALRLEAELAKAKGFTGEAGIRAIEAEYNRRIQLARTPEAEAALVGLKGQAVAGARLGDAQRALDLGQQGLNAQLDAVDIERSRGAITEEQALQKKMALYRDLIPVLQAAADEQLRLARLTGDPEQLVQAQENANGVEQLKANLQGLGEQMDWVKTTARDAFEQGLGNFLESLSDQTTSLTDKVLALGQALAQALLQQATTRIASSITTSLFGPAGHAEGGLITGPGTGTSDSILARLSNQEYVVKAAAVQKYGVGYLNALNGMRLPPGSLPRFADGGLVGSPAGGGLGSLPAPRVRVIVVRDEREAMEALMNGPAGEQAVLQHLNRNPQALGKGF